MAVTFTQSPEPFTPSDNPVVWVFSSDEFAQPNFSFYVEVYVNGVLYSPHLIFPEFNGDTAHFDAEENKISNVICSKPVPDTSAFSFSAANNAEIYIKVYEQYGDPATLHGSETSTTVTVFKAALKDVDFNIYDSFDYEWRWPLSPRAVPLFMTFSPRLEQVYCALNENYWLMFLSDENDLDVKISLYDSAGALIVEDTLTTVAAANKLILINMSPALIITTSAVIDSADFASCAYYTATMVDGDIHHLSESFKIYYNQDCDLYETKRLHFLSTLGGIDAYSFTKANDTGRDITRYSYVKQLGGFDNTGAWVNDLYQGRGGDYLTTSRGRLRINSDYITQGIQNWLVDELCESPLILIETNSGSNLSRAKILTTNTLVKKNSQGNLIQEFIELDTLDNRKSS